MNEIKIQYSVAKAGIVNNTTRKFNVIRKRNKLAYEGRTKRKNKEFTRD